MPMSGSIPLRVLVLLVVSSATHQAPGPGFTVPRDSDETRPLHRQVDSRPHPRFPDRAGLHPPRRPNHDPSAPRHPQPDPTHRNKTSKEEDERSAGIIAVVLACRARIRTKFAQFKHYNWTGTGFGKPMANTTIQYEPTGRRSPRKEGDRRATKNYIGLVLTIRPPEPNADGDWYLYEYSCGTSNALAKEISWSDEMYSWITPDGITRKTRHELRHGLGPGDTMSTGAGWRTSTSLSTTELSTIVATIFVACVLAIVAYIFYLWRTGRYHLSGYSILDNMWHLRGGGGGGSASAESSPQLGKGKFVKHRGGTIKSLAKEKLSPEHDSPRSHRRGGSPARSFRSPLRRRSPKSRRRANNNHAGRSPKQVQRSPRHSLMDGHRMPRQGASPSPVHGRKLRQFQKNNRSRRKPPSIDDLIQTLPTATGVVQDTSARTSPWGPSESQVSFIEPELYIDEEVVAAALDEELSLHGIAPPAYHAQRRSTTGSLIDSHRHRPT